jgi:hypothetical protein
VTVAGPGLYDELASWFHLLTAPAHYAEESALYRRLLVETADGYKEPAGAELFVGRRRA